jgi:peptide deformylase
MNGFFLRLIYFSIFACLVMGCRTSYKFSNSQSRMIMDADAQTPMRVFKITNPSDSILLRTKSTKVNVDPNDLVLKTFIDRLYATVRDSISLGVGIAAPQVGILKNIIWVQRFDKEDFPFEVYLNPEIVDYSDKKQACLEGCLSIPDRRDTTYTRAETILIEYDQWNRQRVRESVSGFTAVIFQHEIDHLNGILYLDHLEKEVGQKK